MYITTVHYVITTYHMYVPTYSKNRNHGNSTKPYKFATYYCFLKGFLFLLTRRQSPRNVVLRLGL